MGVIQIRLVAGVYLFLSAISVAASLIQVILHGAPVGLSLLLPPILWTALAFFLLRGSNPARIAIAVLSAISAAGCLLITVASALTAAFSLMLIYVLIGAISAGIAYLVLFSSDLKEEVLRRAKIRQSADRLNRQKYYEDLGAQYEE